MHYRLVQMTGFFVFFLIAIRPLVASAECVELPTLVYEDLKCVPKFEKSDSFCPSEYDCSHIYNSPKGTCTLKGKNYTIGESPDGEDVASDCSHSHCTCGDKGFFKCIVPSDSCAEFWVPGFVKPGCYLTYEQNRCCSVGQKCPPIDENAVECQVGEMVYREGEKFRHPTEKCVSCICDKSFDGRLDSPACQKINCTTATLHADKLQRYCAPRYLNSDDCCPRSWVCPSNDGIYVPSPTAPMASTPQCKFGDRLMYIGETYLYDKYICKCLLPPFLTCRMNLGKV